MGKTKVVYTGRNLDQCGDPNFDWSPYDDKWDGIRLKINTRVKVANKHDKVYCHESYAQEVYNLMDGGITDLVAKESKKGTVYTVADIRGVSDHEVLIDTVGGMSAIIDLNKEKAYLDSIGCDSAAKFVKAVNLSSDFKKSLLGNTLLAKVVEHDRVSLWDGQLTKVESELIDQLMNPSAEKKVYRGKIESVNNGGYIVDVCGLKCFMPGSLAAAGVIKDFAVLLGKTVPVMVVNYQPAGFVVSYKEYLSKILPDKIEKELYVGKQVFTKVTGESKNGIFVIFRDDEGEWIFEALIHRSVMSKDFERRFDHREFRIGDQFSAYISGIIDANGKKRIVLTDSEDIAKANISKTSEKEEE